MDFRDATGFQGILGGLAFVATEIFGLMSQQGLELGQAWVATRVSLCRDRVFPRVGHSCRDRRFYVATGFSKVLLRQGVFMLRPIGQACVRDRILGACTIGLGMRMSARTSGNAACAIELPAHTAHAQQLATSARHVRLGLCCDRDFFVAIDLSSSQQCTLLCTV